MHIAVTQYNVNAMGDTRSADSCDSSGSGSNDDEQLRLSDATPPKKKRKRLCRFNSSWAKEFSWCRGVTKNCFEVECTLCRRRFSIGHGGRNDLTSHMKSDSHKRNASAAKCSSIPSFYVKSTPTGIDKQVSPVAYNTTIIWALTCFLLPFFFSIVTY
jgi:hypothetical protein